MSSTGGVAAEAAPMRQGGGGPEASTVAFEPGSPPGALTESPGKVVVMDFNAAEIVLLLLLAIVIFGPEKLPDLARKSARVINYVRTIANDARGQLRQELGPELADLKLADLNPKQMLSKHVLGADVEDELKSAAAELRRATTGTGSPETPAEPAAATPARPTPFDPEAT